MQLQSPRLQLLPFEVQDQDLFLGINTDPFVRKYLWDDLVIDAKLVAETLEQNQQHFAQDGFGLWKIQLKTSQETMGYVGLWYFFAEAQPQLVYALLPTFTKKGYATEASRAVIQYAFEELGYLYLLAATDAPNQASQAVALSLGMKKGASKVIDGKETLFFRLDRPENS